MFKDIKILSFMTSNETASLDALKYENPTRILVTWPEVYKLS